MLFCFLYLFPYDHKMYMKKCPLVKEEEVWTHGRGADEAGQAVALGRQHLPSHHQL